MYATHLSTENRYEKLRQEARDVVSTNLPYTDRASIQLKEVDNNALAQAKLWASFRSRQVDWEWSAGYLAFRNSNPKRFELATWYTGTLASLAIGKVSPANSLVRLDFVEARPEANKLTGRVTPIVLSTMEMYAHFIGASEMRIIDPINDRVSRYYQDLGFKLVTREGLKNKTYHV